MSKRRRKARRRSISDVNLYLSSSQVRRVRVSAGKDTLASDIRRMNRDIKNATRYKNPIFPTRTETRVYNIGGIKVRKTIEVQSPLEKQFRSVRLEYNKYSRKELEEKGQSRGRIRIARAKEIYAEKGEQGVNEWLFHMHNMAQRRMYWYNGQKLVSAVLGVMATYDNAGVTEAWAKGQEAYELLSYKLNSPEGINYDAGERACTEVYELFKAEDFDDEETIIMKSYMMYNYIEALN